eukprot:6418030-Pyramimonas_sp.AAC.1
MAPTVKGFSRGLGAGTLTSRSASGGPPIFRVLRVSLAKQLETTRTGRLQLIASELYSFGEMRMIIH